uniref:Uncharacterized protein n=1 Tax=Anopheles coluzzii TaxID=1518534 RepID=A0A8W7PQM5_ANOCL
MTLSLAAVHQQGHGGGGGNGRQHGGINIANEPSATTVNGSVLWCLDVVRPLVRFDEFIFRHQVAMTRIHPATKTRAAVRTTERLRRLRLRLGTSPAPPPPAYLG